MSIGRLIQRKTASTARPAPPSPSSGGSDAELLSHLAVARRVVGFVSARHRLNADEAEEFSSHVTLKLLDDDRAILRKFAGRSSMSTYLSVVIERMFLDYRVASWGKWRPSAEASRQGEIGVLTERLLTRDGFTADEAFEALTTNHRVAISRGAFDQLLARLPVRVRRRFEGEDALAFEADSAPDPERALLDRGRGQDSSRVTKLLQRALAGLEVRDRLLLTYRYEDGRTVAQIAAILGEDQKRLYRRFETLLRQIRESLESEGVAAADIVELFESAPIDVDGPEHPRPCPSRNPGAESGAE